MSVILKQNQIESVETIKSSNGTTAITLNSSGSERPITLDQKSYIAGRPYGSGSSVATSFSAAYGSQNMSFSSNRITVSLDGLYGICYNTICTSTSGRRDTEIRVNGNRIANGLDESNLSGYSYRAHHAYIYLNANDYIEFDHDAWYTNSADTWQTASVHYLG